MEDQHIQKYAHCAQYVEIETYESVYPKRAYITMSCMCECECETQMDVMHVVKTLQTKCACCKIQTCIDLRTFVSFRKSTMIMRHALVSVVSECVVPTTNEHEYNELRTIQEICPHRNVCACVKSIHARML